jgi:hypothetical protein
MEDTDTDIQGRYKTLFNQGKLFFRGNPSFPEKH